MEQNKDYLLKAITNTGSFKIYCARTTNLCEDARNRHNLSLIVSHALGRLLTGTALMGSTLKEHEKMTITVSSVGPIKKLSAEANCHGHVRGYALNKEVYLPDDDNDTVKLNQAIGDGHLIVTKWLKNQKEPYQGITRLHNSEIAQDLAYYLATSEQVLSVVSLGVYTEKDKQISQAGGLFIQKLPDATDHDITLLENTFKTFPTITSLLLEGYSCQNIINLAMKGFKVDFLNETPLSFKCTCSREKVKEVLIALGKDELHKLIDENKDKNEVVCDFCSEKYYFNIQELSELSK